MRPLTTTILCAAAIAVPAFAWQQTAPAEAPAAAPAAEATYVAPGVMTTPPMEGAAGAGSSISAVEAGTYTVDPGHTIVSFTVDHMGITSYTGQFGDPSGTLQLDPANPAAATVEVTFPIASVSTTSADLDKHLQSADFFDAANNPEAKFVSTEVVVEGDRAAIRGDLTLAGVTKPVVLQTKFYGAGPNPMSKELNIGFRATTTIKRSDFGIDYALPMVSDEVLLLIDAAFIKQG